MSAPRGRPLPRPSRRHAGPPERRHEWVKHGTCSGLSPDAYFAEALNALRFLPGDRGTPALISGNVGGEVSAAQLRSEYGRRVAIRADKHCRLSEVTSCFAKGPNGTVGPQIDCPSHVMGGRDSGHCSRFVINELGKCLAGDGQKKK